MLARRVGLECRRLGGEPPEKPTLACTDNVPLSLPGRFVQPQRMSARTSRLSIQEEFKKLHEETLRHFGMGSADPLDLPESDPRNELVVDPADDANKPAAPGPSLVGPSAIESEVACSPLLTSKTPVCAATTRKGQPCRANVLPGDHLCAFHHPRNATAFTDGRAAGGRRSPYVMPAEADPDLTSIAVSLYSQAGIQASLEAIMRMILLGRIPPSHAGILIRCFSVATRNLHSCNDVVRTRDAATYRDRVNAALRAAGLIERDLQQSGPESGNARTAEPGETG